jgi:hypothetical protein
MSSVYGLECLNTTAQSFADSLPQVQPADQFYRNKHTTDKLESQCKQCKRSALQNVTTPTVEQKKCSKCGEVRAANCFDRYKRTSDGLQSQCKDCMKVLRPPLHALTDCLPPHWPPPPLYLAKRPALRGKGC